MSGNEMTTMNLSRLATEINSIKEQTRTFVLNASIEIGRRLKEAKGLVEYGEWSDWLEVNVDYSQRTANNLVKIYDEYGSEQVNFLGEAKSQALANLTYTQAVLMLGIPTDEREEFIESNDIDGMTTRELQEAIKERNDAQKALEKEKAAREEISKKLSKADNAVIELNNKIKELEQQDSEVLAQELEKAKADLQKKKDEVKNLKAKLEEEPQEVIKEVIPEEVQKELEELRMKAASSDSPLMVKYKLQFGEIKNAIDDLMNTLDEVEAADEGEGKKCRGALKGLFEKYKEKVA